jgi:subfamily B ATP-binding cassette protein MsbA
MTGEPQRSLRRDLRTLLDVMRVARVQRGRLIGSALLSGLADVASLAVAALLLEVVRGLVAGGLTRDRFVADVTGLYLAIVAKNALEYASQLVLAREAAAATLRIRTDLLARLLDVGKAYFDRHATSALRDTLVWASEVPATLAILFHNILTRSLSAVVLGGFLVALSLPLTAMAFAIAPLANVVTGAVARRIRRSAQRSTDARFALSGAGWEILAGMSAVHAATAEPRELARFGAASERERDLGIVRQRLELLVGPARELAATSTLLVISWGVGLIDTGLAAADLFVFVYLVQRLLGPLAGIADARIRIAASSEELARIDALLHIPAGELVGDGPRVFAGLARAIEIRDLTFSYQGREPALRGLSLEIAAGKLTAITGTSGSGKTTLASLLLRFYDCPPATILVDGVDLRELDRASWRVRVAYAGQDVFLFDTSLRANLCYGTTRAVPDAELWQLLADLKLDDFANSLPDGLDTGLGERGSLASGGQQQRIAIGRALVRDADVTILDEPTSALDAPTAAAVMAAVARRLAGRTVVVIGHGAELRAVADRVIELAHGTAVIT